MRTFVIAALNLVMTAAPAAAQLDPGMVAQGQILGAMNQGYADRARGKVAGPRTSAARMAVICTKQLPSARAQYGADNADVVELSRLCRRVGY